MPLSFATPPGAPRAPGGFNLPAELESVAFVSAWSGSALHGFDSALRLGGVFVETADVVLGLRSWNDAREGVLTLADGSAIPYAIFEVEKIVRMLLGHSGVAFEMLASPVVYETPDALGDGAFPAQRILNAAVTTDILHHYRDAARGTLARLMAAKGQGARLVDIFGLVRVALTGQALMRAEVDFNLARLLAQQATPGFADLVANMGASDLLNPAWLQEFERAMKAIIGALSPEDAALPTRPSDYDWLNDFVISARLAQRESQRAPAQTSGGSS